MLDTRLRTYVILADNSIAQKTNMKAIFQTMDDTQ